MEKAYIILAHKNPEQVVRLITALDDDHSTFFIHFDKKANASYTKEISAFNQKVVFIKSVHTLWGGFSLVEATLNGMKTIKDHPKHFDFISLISGQHYPIKSNEYINDFLRNSKHHAFLEYTRIPDHDRWKIRGGLYRIDKYFFGLQGYQRFTAKALNFLSAKVSFLKRKFPSYMKPYAGSQWWMIDNYALNYILDFVENHKEYTSYHQHTFAPDELFFHNILLNAEDEKLRTGIANTNLLYMNWPNRDSGHPELLKSADIDDIINSDALFARKFDTEHDADILDLIDENRA